MLKINGKLGGVNWRLKYDIKEPVMVFGADVTHSAPSHNSMLRISVAAVLGSITPDLMRYAAVLRTQNTIERATNQTHEIINNLESMASELLKVSCILWHTISI